ncbi:MAG: hypothetical protein ABSG43_13300 [Solirubrobacteraceae bacterium]|jgi:hypothetical protein
MYEEGPDIEVALIDHWDGATWTPVQEGPSGQNAQFEAVSCVSSVRCMAVGFYQPLPAGSFQPIAYQWNGSLWRRLGPPAALMDGVSCTGPTACVATGEALSGGVERARAEAWNGTRWSLMRLPWPANAAGGLGGVSCSAANACTTVGADNGRALAMRWNGHRWRAQTTPRLAVQGQLAQVSCVSATECFAVGSDRGGLAERWDGRRWNIMRAGFGGMKFGLSGVSCLSRTYCVTVASSSGAGSRGASSAIWNGARWTTAPTAATGGDSLNGVSCVAPGVCEAVGSVNMLARSDAALLLEGDNNPAAGGGTGVGVA